MQVTLTLTVSAEQVAQLLASINPAAEAKEPKKATARADKPEATKPKATKPKATKPKDEPTKPKDEPAPEPEITKDDLAAQIGETIKAVGVESVRELFGKFKAARLSELDAKHYAKFSAALTEARQVLS